MDYYSSAEIHPVLQNVSAQWMRQIERARKLKEEVFGRYAYECQTFYSGPKDWDEMMGNDRLGLSIPDLQFKMHLNKAFEYVKIFGPSLYYANPVRTVKPRAPVQVPGQFFPDPMMFQELAIQEQGRVAIDGIRSILLEAYLNWTPSRYKLDVESRSAVDEALIKGRGVLWTGLTEAPDGAFRAVTSTWDSVDHLLIDPDADKVKDAKWVARRCIQPIWEVERDYGLRRGSLKGNMESLAQQADISIDRDAKYKRAAGYTSDLLVFWQVWSKMGMGGRLAGINPNLRTPLDEIWGDYAYIVVCNTARFPLNLPPELVNDPDSYDDTVRAGQWPIPFHADGKWPFTELDFNQVFNSAWPMATMLAARGELRFLNWIFSFLAGHLRNAMRDFVAVKKSLNEEIKDALLEGKDLTLLELEHDHGAITDAVQFLQHPEVNGDAWKYIEAVQASFDKRVGLNEIMYGGTPEQTQPRSAAESNLRNQSTGIRPDDMAQQVESWQTEVAAKEAFCARYLLGGQDVAVCLGPLASMAWSQYVFTMDTKEAFHQLEYRIEAGTTRKPNKEFQVRQMEAAVQVLLPVFQAYSQTTGDLQPLNNLVSDYCKSMDLDDNRYQMLAAPLPAQLPSSAAGSPTTGGGSEVPPGTGQVALG